MHRAKNTDQQLSLRGKISIKDMGTRVEKTAPFTATPTRNAKLNGALDKLYAYVQGYLEDITTQVLDSACSLLIDVIRDQSLGNEAKKKETESVLGGLTGEEFNKLVNIVVDIKSSQENLNVSDSDEESQSGQGDDNDSVDDTSDDSDTDSMASVPEWCQNPHFLKQLLFPTSIKPAAVLEVLEKDDSEEALVKLFNFEFLDIIEVLLANKNQIYWYTKFLNAETGTEREKAFDSIQNLNLEPSKDSSTMETIDLDSLIPSTSSRYLASSNLSLPDGAEKLVFGSYEQYKLPFLQPPVSDEELVEISSMPEWSQPVFNGLKTLNRIQSRVYDAAFNYSGNLLLCAPTGAGKTNAALLAMLQALNKHKTGKIVYISPLKALVQEQCRTFSERLQPLGVSVAELSGDANMTSDEIANTRVIVTTPEKWDIVTRKTFDVGYTSLVKLVIIDEIHLLHDPRGPALENIVSRYHILDSDTRVIGLSATLPNYNDVASFLKAEYYFYFDSSFRPCPLQQTFCGITEKSVFKQHKALNDICLEKVLEFYKDYQSIVFVHSRKDTARTAQYLIDNSEVFPILQNYETDNSVLSDLLRRGIGIHHAGLSRKDRSLVEHLFADRKLKVLVSTATLAWGVNLPAHAVIIKGTQVYNPKDGDWQELSPQDILQMLGRAGRPGFDTFGEGIVITLHDKLAYYMSVLTSQFPIESQLIERLADSLNAEVSLGTIKALNDGIEWLGKTYYFSRLKSDPVKYRAGIDYDNDGEYKHRRKVIIHSALKWLYKVGMVEYNGETVTPTSFGKIAANFYISPASMSLYMKQLKPYMGPIDILRVFSRSKEFENIPLRKEERLEVQKLGSMVPIPIKDKIDESTAKISILLQAFISKLNLVGMALSADMVYITQSASRLLRAMFELSVAQKWPLLTLETYQLYLMVDKQMWLTSSPLGQFSSCPPEVLRKTENSPMPWARYLEMKSSQEVAKAIRSEKYAELVFSMLQKFPRVEINVMHQPITPSLLRLSIEISPDFRWDRQVHQRSQRFLLLIYDGDAELILHHEWLLISERDQSNIAMQVTVPIIDPLTPVYNIACLSDSWLHSCSQSLADFEYLTIPEKFAAPTQVRYMDPVDVTHIDFPLTSTKPLNMMESQAYQLLYATDSNAFVGINGSTRILAELVFARHFSEPGLIVYIHPNQDTVRNLFNEWKKTKWFEQNMGILAGDLVHDLEVLGSRKIIVSSVANMDLLTRRWQHYQSIQAINVVIVEDAHLIGSQNGYLMERSIIRLKFMATQQELSMRFVAFSYPVAGNELGKWFGASKGNIINYSPSSRVDTTNFNIVVQSFDQRDYNSRKQMMIKSIKDISADLIFVYTRDQCLEVAAAISPKSESFTITTHDKSIAEFAQLGVSFIYSGMHVDDFTTVMALGSKTLIATSNMVHHVQKVPSVVICGTQYYDLNNGAATDYTAVEVINMAGKSVENAYVYTTPGKAPYYDQFLRDPLPVESHLMYYLADTFMVEIAEQVVDSPEAALDWLTYSYFYHRLSVNPSYYGIEGTDQDSVNEYLSELVETTIEELGNENIVEIADDDEMTLTPLDGSFIGSVYGLSVSSISVLNKLKSSSTIRDIFALVCSTEYTVTVDHKQHAQLVKLGRNLPFSTELSPLGNKVQVLLQLHMSRAVPSQWEADLEPILLQALSCVKACIDILSGSGHLNALVALDLHQMLVQGLWHQDSPLEQIPYVDSNTISRAKGYNIETMGSFLSIEEDDIRNTVLGFDETDPRMQAVAGFCNDFPAVDIESIHKSIGDSITVRIIRDIDEDEMSEFHVHGRYPYASGIESWYLIVGSIESRKLYGARKVSISSPEQEFEIPLTLDSPGTHSLSVWCICSGYLDADKESQVQVII